MSSVEARIRALLERGVEVVDPRQTFVAPDVDLGRIQAKAVLHPGTRLQGPRTYLGAGAVVGAEGPATLIDCALASGAAIDGGFARGAVLLRGARAGSAAHLREGTLLEEEASTAHAVGLKQTIFLSFVTAGSLINFCDALVAGGTSRTDHSEIGSGYIHFNFTPWGERGDKATPSLVGDVVHGVFLRSPRIFLGGSGGMVGPRRVGFGAVTAAGQVLRRDVPDNRLVLEAPHEVDAPFNPSRLDAPSGRARKNFLYIAQLVALREWYRRVRLPGCQAAGSEDQPTLAALELLDGAIEERCKRVEGFLLERNTAMPQLDLAGAARPSPLAAPGPAADHVAHVRSLTPSAVEAGQSWLQTVVEAVLDQLPADLRPPGRS